MDILECASKISANTEEPWKQDVEKFISRYKERGAAMMFGNPNRYDDLWNMNMLKTFRTVAEDGYDISGFGLAKREAWLYAFSNKETGERFDVLVLVVDRRNLTDAFISYPDKNGFHDNHIGTTIQEAIKNYGT